MKALVVSLLVFLAACTAADEPVLSEQERIEFREDAMTHVGRQVDWCPITNEAALLALYESVKQRSKQFLSNISGTELESEYVDAKAAWEELSGSEVAECSGPYGLEHRKIIEEDVADYEALMGRLERWVQLVEKRS